MTSSNPDLFGCCSVTLVELQRITFFHPISADKHMFKLNFKFRFSAFIFFMCRYVEFYVTYSLFNGTRDDSSELVQ